ncbi:MAG: hemerythrin domain-containing protein [Pseudorhodoplanes sp.]|nr:hemerythrin domain-containing protein [Pseudorhodoplanes sp.]
MSFANRICQTLHEEHRATIALMERLEQLMAKFGRGGIPDRQDPTVARMLGDLSVGVEAEVARHFDFEEHQLFPFLEAAGDSAIGEHLTSEHAAMRPLGLRMAHLAREASANGFDAASWEEFRKIGQELSDRMLAHVQKEEMALLPLLDEVMDAEVEARLYQDYVETM